MAAVTGPAPASSRRRARLPRFALAIPAWVWYLLFFVLPLVVIAIYSLGYKPAGVDATSSIGLDRLSFHNYGQVIGDETFATVFRATLRISVVGTLLCLVVGFPLAYFLATRVSDRFRGIVLGLVIVPFWTSFLLRTFAWRLVLAPRGFLSNFLQDVGVLGGPIEILDTRLAVQIGVLYNYLPLMVFPLFVALDRIDPRLREAAKDLGAGRVKTFLQITLPLARSGIVAGILLTFIPLSGEYVTPTILGGAKGAMAGGLVASQFLEAQNWALGSAMAMVLIVMILAAIALVGLVVLAMRAVARRATHLELGT